MKAMVLAAGLGTRLRPLTDDRPKALVEVAGRTLLELTLCRLRAVGVNEVIVNAHHFADKLAGYLEGHDGFGMRVEVSREDVLLDTGGGLKKAAYFFRGSDEPFILHNVDVLSNIDLKRLVQEHIETRSLATLAVQDRPSSRYLLFDQQSQLCGRRIGPGGDEMARPAQSAEAMAFSGIHVLCPRIFSLMKEQGVFSIIDVYLRLAGSGEKICAFHADGYYWRDLGKPESVAQAEDDLRRKILIA
jgi:NDP-sugar pyrophosphorylase family protein